MVSRVGKIMRRLLGRSTADSTANETSHGTTNSPVPLSYRPNASQNVVYTTGAPILCMDRSVDGQFAVLGGRHILKTVQLDGLTVHEGVDIRAIITAQQNTKPGSSTSVSDQLSIRDVKWVVNQGGEPSIFTACANGRIFQYNVSRLGSGMAGGTGLEFIQTREDSRQVNKLCINPHRQSWLLSGSQDGVVRCFDVKAPVTNRNGQATFRTFQAFKCNAEGIRDVKWSHKDGMIFACATESGAVLKWDIRKANAPLLRINAHDTQRGTSSISWHPDGEHLVSAGLDSKCHVWDMSKGADKKQKPKWTISTPAPIAVVAWRPALWSATAQGRRAAQVAVSYDDGGANKRYGINSVHIWDLARPTMPYKEIRRFESSPSALLWHDQDLLWTAGSDCLFTQCDVAFASKVIDHRPLSSLDFSPQGDVLMMLEQRPHPPRPRPTVVASDLLQTSSYSSSPSGQMLSVSRSDSEEDVVGTFLGPRRRISRKRGASTRSANVLSTTPPSGPGTEDPVIPLEQALGLTAAFRPQQVMAIGRVPTTSKSGVYEYLSAHYLETLEKELPYVEGGSPLNERVSGIMEHYARAAENVSQFRLAQTWRVLAYAFNLLLTRRSQYHLEVRSARRKDSRSPGLKYRTDSKISLPRLEMPTELGGQETPRKAPSVTSVDSRQTLGRSLLSEEFDSESNVPTPIARPVGEDALEQHQYFPGTVLTPVKELDSFTLPAAFHGENERPGLRERLDSVPFSVASQDSHVSSTEGYDFYDLKALESLPKAIDVPKKKEPLSLDYVGPRTPHSKKRSLARQDSDESFAQMFSVSDGSRPTMNIGSYSNSLRRVINQSDAIVSSNRSSDEEYQSRIRGKQIQDSPETSRHPIPKGLQREDSGSYREIFMISQTTADSTEPSQEENYELSQQSPEQSPAQIKVTQPASPRKTSNERLALERPEERTSTTITETDFMPWPDDPPYPHPLSSDTSRTVTAPPLKPYDLLSRALTYEAKSSALNASAMILLLKPLVADDIIDPHQASAILRQHHNRLMGQKLFIEAALLRNLCVGDWPGGIEIWGDNYTAVFLPAQERVSAAFACPQCHKPREVDRSKPDGPGIWKCERCRATMAPCAICGHRDATQASLPPMPIANGLAQLATSNDAEKVLSTWWYCPGCSHGGHATCLQGWHSTIPAQRSSSGMSIPGPSTLQDGLFPETYSDGCCPLDGCGHACLPGKWRNETSTARTEELGRAVREQTRGSIPALKHNESRRVTNADVFAGSAPAVVGGVRSDSLEVSQSRAVESVRGALAVAGLGSGSSTNSSEDTNRLTRAAGGILSVLSSSPGRSSSLGSGAEGIRPGERTERERRKSVKFAGTTEERR
ncbi:WD domain-containing protein [Xylariales sp. AK1849]|nr:WD domain-containing protein [Xylariales sp. AK1849]